MNFKSFDVKTTNKIKKFSKIIEVDSDKSISIRSFLISSISLNISTISNILESEDVFSTISCLKLLGVKIVKIKKKTYKIYGKGLGSLFCKKKQILDCGNSGTLVRLLVGILSTNPNINVTLKGDHSLSKRNMSKLIDLMSEFGANFYPKNKNTLPLNLVSCDLPIGINYNSGVSAQLKSAVILAGLNAYGNTSIKEKQKSRNHTENMLLKNPKSISLNKGKINLIKIFGKKQLKAFDINIPGDPSSAAFFCALCLLTNRSKIKIKNVQLNPTRIGFYEILKKNGAKIFFKNLKNKSNELIGDIYVNSSNLKPLKVNKEFYVKATDEYPILFVIAALTPGVSIFKGISDLANKESNRIEEMKKILVQIGVKCKSDKNSLKIFGINKINELTKTINVPNLGDHRICMSSVILSLLTGIKFNIKNFETVGTSSPSFLKIIKSLGGQFEIKKKS